jgi:hypothetical protein
MTPTNPSFPSIQSQAVKAGGFIFVSGQIPAKPDGTLLEGSIADKTALCCEGLKHILEAAGSSFEKITKVRKPRRSSPAGIRGAPPACVCSTDDRRPSTAPQSALDLSFPFLSLPFPSRPQSLEVMLLC